MNANYTPPTGTDVLAPGADSDPDEEAIDLDAAHGYPPLPDTPNTPKPSEAVKFALGSLGHAITNRIHEAGNDPQQYFGDVKRLLRAVEIVGRVSTLEDDDGDEDENNPFMVAPPYGRRRRRRGNGALVGPGGGGLIGANPMDNMVGQMVDALVQHAPTLQGAVRQATPPEALEFKAADSRRYAIMDEFHMVQEMLAIPNQSSTERERLRARASELHAKMREEHEQKSALDTLDPRATRGIIGLPDHNEPKKEENNGNWSDIDEGPDASPPLF